MNGYWRNLSDYWNGSPWSEASIREIVQPSDDFHQHSDMDELDIIRLLNAICDEGPMDYRPAFSPTSANPIYRRRPGFCIGNGSSSFRSQSTSQTAPVGSSSNPSRRFRQQPQPNGTRRRFNSRGRGIHDGSSKRRSASLLPITRVPNTASNGPSPVSTACGAEASVSRTAVRSPRRKNGQSQATQTSSSPKRTSRRRSMDSASATAGEDTEVEFLTSLKLSNKRRERRRKKVESASQQALAAIECPICMTHFDDERGRVPCTLACGHSFCMAHMKKNRLLPDLS